MFSEKELNLEEHQLREQIRQLSPAEMALYDQLEIPRLKQADIYLRLNLLFPFGVHHFYLHRWGRGALSLGLTLGAIMSATGFNPWDVRNHLLALMLLLAMIIIEVPQLMNARHLVHSRNNRIMHFCLSEVRRLWPGDQP
ncbi:MAG: TM2 domain-containing protein [Pseudohongiella sp.]|nr:TM2 domain-containing protein [Pseudohongiella sp.]MDO9519242.1 TM2 domain-containing protein [Pseudohongiella sp.]MDP2128353.1 TM2 domain-containing protein [Pseudohongiella sp.]